MTSIFKDAEESLKKLMFGFSPILSTEKQKSDLIFNALAEAEHYKDECFEQARLLGISGSKELRLMTENEQLRKERDELAEYVYKVGNGKTPVIAKYYTIAKRIIENA